MKDYQKVLLYAYPKLERMAEDIGQIVLAKARASVMGRETALACAEKLIRYNFLRGQILFLKDELDGMRTYFRRQQRLARAVNAELVRRGLTEEWFFEAFSGVSFFMSALESVRRAEGRMVDKRIRAGIPCAGRSGEDQSGCS